MTTETASHPVTARPHKVTDASFETDVLKADGPVVVDFWAEWCGPCHMIAPILEELAVEFGDRITVAKLNIDENPRTAAAYRIQSIPTLLMFKNGEPVAFKVGAAPKGVLTDWIKKGL